MMLTEHDVIQEARALAKMTSPKGAGKTMYLLSACFCYGNGYLASYPDLT